MHILSDKHFASIPFKQNQTKKIVVIKGTGAHGMTMNMISVHTKMAQQLQ